MKFTFCISRTDSIGDVILTLPLAGYLKKHFPESKIIFLARSYTKAIVNLSQDVDEVLLYDNLEGMNPSNIAEVLKKEHIDYFIHVFPNKDLAKAAKIAKIPNRIGTSHRFFHQLTCNRIVSFTRKNSDLHEAQLNFELLTPILGKREIPSFDEISNYLNIENINTNNFNFDDFNIDEDCPKIILHPKSQGSAVEWGVEKFVEFIHLFENKKVAVIVTGTERESEYFRKELPNQANLHDLSGKLTLEQLVTLIQKSDYLVAASTGPLHIAGILGVHALGLFSSRRPIHPGRWRPIGSNSDYLVYDKNCEACRKENQCDCISNISPLKVYEKLEEKGGVTFL